VLRETRSAPRFRYLGAFIAVASGVVGTAFVVFASWFWVKCGENPLALTPLFIVTILFFIDCSIMAKGFLAGEWVLKR